jgi:hypothetical protein
MADKEYTIVAPDGKEITLIGPEGASQEQIIAQAQKLYQPNQQSTQAPEKPVNPYESTFREALQNVPESKRFMGSALAGLGGETIKNIGAATELVNSKYGKPIAQFGQAMTNVASEANPVMGTIGQIGSYFAPTSLINKGGELLAASSNSPKFAKTLTNVGGNMGLGFLTTEGTGQEGLVDRAKSAALAGGLSVGLPIVGAGISKLANILRGPEQTAQMAGAIEKARDLGYVVPPTQANSTLLNKALEGISGKISTAQNASAKNQQVTNNLASKALGLPEDTIISPEILKNIRNTAGQAYENIKLSGTVKTSPKFIQALDNIAPYKDAVQAAKDFPDETSAAIINVVNSLKRPNFDVSSAVSKINMLRNDADVAYRNGNSALGKTNKDASQVIENTIENHLANTKQTELLDKFREARQLIAKTYSVEKALNPATGTVNATNLAAQLKKGKPLSSELKDIAEFNLQFPKATQTKEAMGSLPQISPLDFATGIIAGANTGGAGAASMLARPIARSLALSPFVQNRLIQQPNMLPANDASQLARMLMLQQTTQGTQP